MSQLPAGIVTALSTQRHQLAEGVGVNVKEGRLVLSVDDQVALIGLIGDLIQQGAVNQRRLHVMQRGLQDIRETGKGLEESAEKLMVLAEKCCVGA